MGRLHRVIDDGLFYPAINRGNNRADVFAKDADYVAFLETLATTKERYPFQLFSYCLMTNHSHLLLRPKPGQSISRILQSLTVAHTWRYHRQHKTSGHVWQGRFKSPVIQDDLHLLVVLRYIEANPLRAAMFGDLADYRWSSYQSHGMGRDDPLLSDFPEWLELGATDAERRRHRFPDPHVRRPGAGLPAVHRGVPQGHAQHQGADDEHDQWRCEAGGGQQER